METPSFCEEFARYARRDVALAGDTGYLAGPTPAEAVRIVGQLLLENGFKEQELEIMLKTNPRGLIYPLVRKAARPRRPAGLPGHRL